MIQLSYRAFLVFVFSIVCFAHDAVLAEDRPEFIDVVDIFSENGVRRIKPDWDEIDKHPLRTEGNPVRCEMPEGERAYLNRLVCMDGNHPTYSRIGSFGQGPYGQIMDAYDVACTTPVRTVRFTIYMDMYHSGYNEVSPTSGFEIEPIVKY